MSNTASRTEPDIMLLFSVTSLSSRSTGSVPLPWYIVPADETMKDVGKSPRAGRIGVQIPCKVFEYGQLVPM